MIRFARIDSQEKLEAWKEFAASFYHPTDADLPITTMSEGDKMFGYYHSMIQPVIFPAFHPEFTTKRNFRDAIEQVSAAHCLASISPQYPNGVCYAALNPDPAVDSSLIGKLFENMDKVLHRRIG